MPGRKVLEKADKAIRVTRGTFTKWRKQREDLGFGYDEDFAQYLLRVGESLQKMNMLEQEEFWPSETYSSLRYGINYFLVPRSLHLKIFIVEIWVTVMCKL